jgi:peroxiredoxin Q/BCP
LEADLAKFQDKNTKVLGIAVQSQTDAQKAVNSTKVTYPILADPDHSIADAFGVYNLLGDRVATPAAFIIDPSGRIVWSYIGKNINDRPSNKTILENIPS